MCMGDVQWTGCWVLKFLECKRKESKGERGECSGRD